ncbi:akirin 2 [Chrysochromulina tobinii]|uniref:Akirin 2 n=1 Tax=Chrysochromulina tobinii TaxID=1460289 RepID=A0A0M0JWJ8_9EUKA|nr:akirin 2 [Chrysochromulina tobinii]|eukprot:KOO31021.1 akirin 2 [Chrysochromulina sp. CCMP291]
MSAAMLMAKRPREEAGEVAMMVTGCSPHRWKFTESPSPASKRTRSHAEAVAAASTCSSAFMVTDGGAGPSSVGTDLSATFRHPQRIDPHTGEALFSMEQVKDIVRRAVDEKERALREQYDRILSTKLQEQYMAFAKFNEDYISRSLKSNDLQSYIS